MADHELVLYERIDGIAILRLNRPEKRNAVNSALANDMRAALKRFAEDEEALVAIITSQGEFFCAGMDLGAFAAGESDAILGGPGRFAGLTGALPPKPIIAAVEGGAVGGGFEIVLACDMVIATENAFFAMPEVSVGLFANAGGAIRLPKIMPAKPAMAMMLTGARITARGALEYGLLNGLAPEGQALETAMDLARKITANAPLAVQGTLKVARESLAGSDALWGINDEVWAKIAASKDAQEGPAAFSEKRPPCWSGE